MMLQANGKKEHLLCLSDLKMPEITPRKQTDIKHTEHDFHQLAQEFSRWKWYVSR